MGSAFSNIFKLLALSALVALNVNDDRVTETDRARCDNRDKELQRLERTSMAPDEHRKIITSYIKDELPFITFVLIDSHLTNIEVLQDVLERCNSSICHKIQFLICQRASRGIVVILPFVEYRIYGLDRLKLFCLIYTFFSHDSPSYSNLPHSGGAHK